MTDRSVPPLSTHEEVLIEKLGEWEVDGLLPTAQQLAKCVKRAIDDVIEDLERLVAKGEIEKVGFRYRPAR